MPLPDCNLLFPVSTKVRTGSGANRQMTPASLQFSLDRGSLHHGENGALKWISRFQYRSTTRHFRSCLTLGFGPAFRFISKIGVSTDNSLPTKRVSGKSTRVHSSRSLSRIIAAWLFAAVCGSAFAQTAASLDDIAKLLAGLPVNGPLAGFTQDQRGKGHAAALDKAWETKEYFQLGPIAKWMSAHAPECYHYGGQMYYMFRALDFLYADAFFPNANTYILAGLEPLG